MVASSPDTNMLLELTTNTLFLPTNTITNSNSFLLTAPKAPFYGYLLYCEEARLYFLATNPTMTVEALSQIIEGKWTVLTERERQDYSERAKELNWQNLTQDEKNMYQEMVTNIQDSNTSFENIKQDILSREAPELDDTRPLKKSRLNTSSIITTASTANNLATTQSSIMGDINLFERQQEDQFVAFPKPPSPAFLHFSNYIRPRITAQHPNKTYGGINKLIKDHWNSMLKEDREPWEQQAKEDEKRFQKENLCFLATRTLKQATETVEALYNQNIKKTGVPDKENSNQSDDKTNNTVTSATSTNTSTKSTTKAQKTSQKYPPIKLRPILPRPLQSSNNNIQEKIPTTIPTPSPSIAATQPPLKPHSIQPHYLLSQHPDLKFGLQVPIRAKSAYQHFYTKFADNFTEIYPDTSIDQFLKTKWSRLSSLDRELWESKAKEDYERFRHEKDVYLKNQHKCYMNSQNGVSLAEFFKS